MHKDSENSLISLAIVTKEMKNTFRHSCKVVMIDSTYKCNVEDYTLFNVITLDQHSQGYAIGQAFIANETSETLATALTSIEEMHGTSLDSVEIILTDRDWAQLSVFQKKLPHATVLLCSWHVLQVFWRYSRKLKGAAFKHNMYLLARRLIYAKSQEEFNERFRDFQEIAGKEGETMVQSITNNWMANQHQWAHCYRTGLRAYSMNTNSRVERFNLLVKGLILGSRRRKNQRPTLAATINLMLTGLQNAYAERQAVELFREMKEPIIDAPSANTTLHFLSTVLSVAGFRLVMKHLRQHQIEDVEIEEFESDVYSLLDHRNQKQYTVCMLDGTCTCTWQNTFGIPCHHVLKILHVLGINEERLLPFVDSLFLRKETAQTEGITYPMAEEVTSGEDSEDEKKVERNSRAKSKRYQPSTNEIFTDTKPLLNDLGNAISSHSLPQVKVYQKYIQKLVEFVRGGLVPIQASVSREQQMRSSEIGQIAANVTY
jgi:hypothetical protein